MDDPTTIMNPILREVNRTLEEMKNTTSLEERKIQSKIVKNLAISLNVFFDFAATEAFSPDIPGLDYDEE